MRVVMDSDCLIKLTKAGLKEAVCAAWVVTVPERVRRETVDAAPARPDALRIGENVAAGRLAVAAGVPTACRGEDAVLHLHRAGDFDAVATDDARFIRQLRGLGVPYVVPAVIVVGLHRAGLLSDADARDALQALRPHISPEEHAAAFLILTRGTPP
jgi:rRNA-processing protein FCF1